MLTSIYSQKRLSPYCTRDRKLNGGDLMQDPNKITFPPDTKVYPSSHGSKEDDVSGWGWKSAHLICPVMVNGQQLYGHKTKGFAVEGWDTLL